MTPNDRPSLQALLDAILAIKPPLDQVLAIKPPLDEVLAIEPSLDHDALPDLPTLDDALAREFPPTATPFDVNTVQETPR
ncbi:hypothetical protein ACQPW1_29525 [Nocardia sp. CA-128927]|uniref:hypothetical protein n=1 Tax=Nocardia sp. CA-128927 TaxID=3239975 RepID=UPI003D99F6B8